MSIINRASFGGERKEMSIQHPPLQSLAPWQSFQLELIPAHPAGSHFLLRCQSRNTNYRPPPATSLFPPPPPLPLVLIHLFWESQRIHNDRKNHSIAFRNSSKESKKPWGIHISFISIHIRFTSNIDQDQNWCQPDLNQVPWSLQSHFCASY